MCPQFAHIVYIYFGIIFNLPTHRFTYMIYQFYIHNKNLLYTAGVSRILGLQICSPTVGPCSYKSKEACNLSEYKAKCFILSTGCQHILIWYISGICHTHKTYTRSEKTILSILGDTCRRLVYVDEEGGRELKHRYLQYRKSLFLVQMAPQASWPSSMPLGLQNHCLGSCAGVI